MESKAKDTLPVLPTATVPATQCHDPKIIKAVARERAKGSTVLQTVDKVGISKSTVQKIMRQPEVKKMIEEQSRRLMALLPNAVDLVGDTMEASSTAGVRDGDYQKERNLIQLRKLALDQGALSILKAGGLLPTQAAAPTIQTLIIQADTAVISPNVSNTLSVSLGSMAQPDNPDSETDKVPSNKGISGQIVDVTPGS